MSVFTYCAAQAASASAWLSNKLKIASVTTGCLLGVVTLATSAEAQQIVGDQQFISSATVSNEGTVTLPLYRGFSHGRTIHYIITETSDAKLSAQLGVNFAPALANARNGSAVQKVTINSHGLYVFPATVTFGLTREVKTNSLGLPISGGRAGAKGESGYSPLIQLPNGIILNAPHVAGPTGQAARIITRSSNTVTMELVDGFQGFQPVRYLVTEASDESKAALENVTWAPRLEDIEDNAAAALAAMVAGQTGILNPERQGLGAWLNDNFDPLNIVEFVPGQSGYSPIWESEPHQWTQSAVNTGQNTRQTDYDTVEDLEQIGLIFNPVSEGYVNCPVVTRRLNSVNPNVALTITSISKRNIFKPGSSGFPTQGATLDNIFFATTVTVEDGLGRLASGVNVSFSPFGAAFGSPAISPNKILSCTTNSIGTCTVTGTQEFLPFLPIAVGGIQTYIGPRK